MFCAKPRVTLDDGSYKLLCLASVEGIAVPRYSQSVS